MRSIFFKKGLFLMVISSLFGCSYEPEGRWEATNQVEVYEKNDHPLKVIFIVEKGEVCAMSKRMLIRKDLGYSQVSCKKGRGWITSGDFKKLSD
jgi:hypothetical protein